MRCKEQDNARQRARHRDRQLKKSIVYLITTKDERYGKIGMTKNPIKRLRMLQQGNPVELKILRRWVPLVGARKREKQLHTALADYCVGGEWFALTEGFWNLWSEI